MTRATPVEIRAAFFATAGYSQPLPQWKFVAFDDQPADGLYVAIYRDNGNLPVGLCGYGAWEYQDTDGTNDDADDEGMVRGFGWTEDSTDQSGDGYVHSREVVAYWPVNFASSEASLKAIRASLIKREAGAAS
ncbi:hypothetical protein [Nevskia ramosa]|uniref:hypothetical protein n=1 Tax=Nevskia ramosa TaxID=64002 RepID=UPI003D0B15F7